MSPETPVWWMPELSRIDIVCVLLAVALVGWLASLARKGEDD